MNRTASIAAIAAALCVWSSPLTGQTVHELGKAPKFRPGEIVVETVTQADAITRSGGDKKVFEDARFDLTFELSQQVIEVDEQGRVQAFLATVSATQHGSSALPESATYKKVVSLKNVSAVVRRSGEAFAADMSTLASPDMTGLTASQLGLVKRIFHDRMQFSGCDETTARLVLPVEAVAVGQSWRPQQAALAEWLKSSRLGGVLGAEPMRAEFKLVSVRNNIATVSGVVQLASRMGGMDVRARASLQCQIGTGSGRWFSRNVDKHVEGSAKELLISADGRQQAVNLMQPGAEAPASRPAGLHPLGWADPGKDTNRYRNAALGVSLDVPAAYAEQKDEDQGPGSANFAGPGGRSISVTSQDPGHLIDMEELAPQVLYNVKAAIADFKLLKQETVTLANNVPAAVFVGRCFKDTSTLVMLVAIDGTRRVNVTMGAETADPGFAAEAEKIVRSLRVFPPEPAKE